MHSGREYISVKELYSAVIAGPSPAQIARSLSLTGTVQKCEFILAPKSRRGNSQVISGVVVSARVIDRTGPAWMLVINEISLSGTNKQVREKEIKIYYHSSGQGLIVSEA